MKYINILLIFFLASCEPKEPVSVKEIISNEVVTILPNVKNPSIRDSIPLSVPIEFEITINSSNLKTLDLFCLIDGKRLLDDFLDYQVYDKQNKSKPIHTLDLSSKKITIIIKERNHLISKKDALKLLKKYKINQSLDNLKFGDTLKLISSNKFRKENEAMINEFNKVNDSLVFRAILNGGKMILVKKKINW
ncbi:hypothetical protein [Flavobacterium johnsoniae]|uniref:hypothetical protein n=1 Tax=Flavobacterium johnsoniae TaxID=986 RepID=UPI000EAD797C|nr:hypothetical protein [Flavobacterium johnsoniae]